VILGLDHVQLAMPKGEEARARAFYGSVLGLEETEKPEALKPRGGLWFKLGEGELHLGVEEPFTPARKAHPALRVSGLEALAVTLAAHGVCVSWDKLVPGMRRFYAPDPFGNRLEFLEPC
jgi:catechol 2,3-dioxygenase-like lactoylglutathione lyase family enzyme